ncbi:hypothetical protein [Vibrio rhizosphaerae]|uniref:Uncharacterized protein n=1 Tax=Vibrio rhizosphaerae TaxID=398736 RepID=A0ABU4IQX8_9VIBR|nr:hypothetical protein [Vibrio rhizosphaerae]MDW6091807.1 hypothetical protein [Vibrio rhizosphaerae]
MRKQLSWFLLLPSIFSGYALAEVENAPYFDQLLSADYAQLSRQVTPIESAQRQTFVPMQLDLSDPDFSNQVSLQPQAGKLEGLAEHVAKTSAQNLMLSATAEDGPDTVTPLCDTLASGSLYTLSGVQKDGVYCYHFEVKQRSKMMALLVGQAETTDMKLSVLKHGADDQLFIVGTSDHPGNADEVVSAVVEPGHYYWYMEAKAAENASIQFGVSVNSAIDAYEPNDTPQTSTRLPETRNMIVGNIDSASDLDYYLYTVEKGKKIDIEVDDSHSPKQWLFSLSVLSGSVEREDNTSHYVATEGTQLLLQVKHNPAKTVDASKQYRVLLGPSVASMQSSSVQGEPDVVRLMYSDTSHLPNVLRGPAGLFLTTQVYNKLTWQAKLTDSTGQPAANAQVNFLYDLNLYEYDFQRDGYHVVWNPSLDSAYTDKQGVARGTIIVGRNNCELEREVVHTAYVYNHKVTYRTGFDTGVWKIEVPGTPFGVGDYKTVMGVTLGHICTQKVLNVEG